MEENPKLHLVMFPWLAMGHLIPFIELAKSLALRGHHMYFLSTPRNLERLPAIPPSLSPLIHLISLPFPQILNLPSTSQSSTDIPIHKTQLLKRAFDQLQPHVSHFLDQTSTSTHPIDWIIYDYASHWLPRVAKKLNIPCVYFSLFNAATLSFFGPPWAMLSPDEARLTPEAYTVVPKWIPFHSHIVYRRHEMLPYFEGAAQDVSDVSDVYRFGVAIRDCEFIAIRTCSEFEPEWIHFLSELDDKVVVPVGPLHPSAHANEIQVEVDKDWVIIKEWLEKHNDGCVVYVALGTESVLSQNQVTELALGLERSELPFIWVLRAQPEWDGNVLEMLPDGFQNRVAGRGVVWTTWVPQTRILGHPSVGGMLTHCGWNSVVEALGFGRVLVMLPMLNDQGLNARLLGEKKLGLELQRDHFDGSFTSNSVAVSLRMAMVDKQGEVFRNNAKQMENVFGNTNHIIPYVDTFIQHLRTKAWSRTTSLDFGTR